MNKRDVDKIAKKLHSLRLKESNKVCNFLSLFLKYVQSSPVSVTIVQIVSRADACVIL